MKYYGSISDPKDLINKEYADSIKDQSLPKSGGTMTGDINMAGHKVTGLPIPTDAGDAVNKGYVDAKTRYWTLIDSVTLTEAVASYAKTLPANTYREIYLVGKIVISGGLSDINTNFVFQETFSGHRVTMVHTKCTDGQEKYVFARMMRLPHRGTAGMISVSKESYYESAISATPGMRDREDTGEYIPSVCLSIAAQYTEDTALMDVGTKIQIWGR